MWLSKKQPNLIRGMLINLAQKVISLKVRVKWTLGNILAFKKEKPLKSWYYLIYSLPLKQIYIIISLKTVQYLEDTY